jgi:hypothetical protein
MFKRRPVPWLASLAVAGGLAAPGLRAQYASPPTAYTESESGSMMGVASAKQITRDGSKVLVDESYAADQAHPKGRHTRTLYDLQAHTNYTWDLVDASAPCAAATFSGDWGDPFASSAEFRDGLAKMNPQQIGNETVNGFAAKVIEAVEPNSKSKYRLWMEPQYGMVVKIEAAGPDGKTMMSGEVKKLTVLKPNASVFALPAACAKASLPARVPTAEERVAAEIGANSEDLIDATKGPGSKNSCTMLLRIVGAPTMQPIAGGYYLALDLNVDFEHPPHYVMGAAPRFSGGAIKEYTDQVRNGTLRIDNVPDHFNLEMLFDGGGASAYLYRQCSSPRSVLLYVFKNPNKLTDGGDWMWVKSGKFATVAGQ